MSNCFTDCCCVGTAFLRPCESAPLTMDWTHAMESLGVHSIMGCADITIEHDNKCLGQAGELSVIEGSSATDMQNMTTSALFQGGSVGEQYKVTFWVKFRACNGQESIISDCIIVQIANC